MGCIYPRVSPELAWVLQESGYSLLVLGIWPWSQLSLSLITVLGYRGPRPPRPYRGLLACRPLHGLSYPWVLGDDNIDTWVWRRPPWRRPLLVTPTPGDAHTWRRPHLATPMPGDTQNGQPIDFLPWGPLVSPTIRLTLTLTFDFGQRPGTGRYTSPPVLSWHLFSEKRLRPRPTIHVAFWWRDILWADDVTFFTWWYDTLSHALISPHVAQSHDHHLAHLALLKFTLYVSKTRAPCYCFITLSHSSALFIFSKLPLHSLFELRTSLNSIIKNKEEEEQLLEKENNRTKTQEHKLQTWITKEKEGRRRESSWRWMYGWMITPLEGWRLLDECASRHLR